MRARLGGVEELEVWGGGELGCEALRARLGCNN